MRTKCAALLQHFCHSNEPVHVTFNSSDVPPPGRRRRCRSLLQRQSSISVTVHAAIQGAPINNRIIIKSCRAIKFLKISFEAPVRQNRLILAIHARPSKFYLSPKPVEFLPRRIAANARWFKLYTSIIKFVSRIQ
jgi:hypothetical protein